MCVEGEKAWGGKKGGGGEEEGGGEMRGQSLISCSNISCSVNKQKLA